jgi:hypothetical protein
MSRGSEGLELRRRPVRIALAVAVVTGLVATGSALAGAVTSLTQVSHDPYTNSTSYHRTEVEPDTLAFGTTVVATFQVGRFSNGGSSNIGWATSTDSGSTWTHGFLPKTTVYSRPAGPWARISDPSVAYDAAHKTWIIATLAIDSNVNGAGVITSRSIDGGATWLAPTTVTTVGSFVDKSWIACDNAAASPYYGRCYTEWDDAGLGGALRMAWSSDGAVTWHLATTPSSSVIGGQPLAQPNGHVIVPILLQSGSIGSFKSTDGGATYTGPTVVTGVSWHGVAGYLRQPFLPSAEVDGAGTVYVAWPDCRFRTNCSSNDIVYTTSTNGTTWTAVARVPIDASSSTVDHFIPGIGVDPATSGASAHVAVTYYFYPNASCDPSTCKLGVGQVTSADGGAHWTRPSALARGMSLTGLPLTNQGYMVGDYMSTSWVSGRAVTVFAQTNGSTCSISSADCAVRMVAPTLGPIAG